MLNVRTRVILTVREDQLRSLKQADAVFALKAKQQLGVRVNLTKNKLDDYVPPKYPNGWCIPIDYMG